MLRPKDSIELELSLHGLVSSFYVVDCQLKSLISIELKSVLNFRLDRFSCLDSAFEIGHFLLGLC